MSVRPGVYAAVLGASLIPASSGMAAQAPQPMVPHAGLPGLRTVTPAQYGDHLRGLQTLVAACQRSEAACDSKQVGDLDDVVHTVAEPDYRERYGWLRDLLEDRNDPGHKRRNDLLPAAAQRLREQLTELEGAPSNISLTASQKSARRTVLARKEFRGTESYSWRDRLDAWISKWLDRLFGGVSTLGRMAPWIGTVIEWGTLLTAALLLFVWIYRSLDRQRVAIGRLTGGAAQAQQRAESRAWAEKARALAERGEWRDAVHAIYWASIVLLEDRRTLRRNATRTPREALRLIDPASHLREPLQAQTAAFERIWYGLRPAAAGDYQAALQRYNALQAGHPAVAVHT